MEQVVDKQVTSKSVLDVKSNGQCLGKKDQSAEGFISTFYAYFVYYFVFFLFQDTDFLNVFLYEVLA